MPYLNVDIHYFSNIKTRRLAAILGPAAEILPIRLWSHCAEHHPEDGVLSRYSTEEIETLMGWRGQRGKAIAALVKVGFLDPLEFGYRVHDWLDHEGHISAFKRRSHSANLARWAAARQKKEGLPEMTSESQTAQLGSPPDAAPGPESETRSPSRTPCPEPGIPPTTHTQPYQPYLLHQPHHPEEGGAVPAPGSAEFVPALAEQIRIYVGDGATISPTDAKTLAGLERKHGRSFTEACKLLHPGVQNVVGYLLTVLHGSSISSGRRFTRDIAGE